MLHWGSPLWVSHGARVALTLKVEETRSPGCALSREVKATDDGLQRWDG